MYGDLALKKKCCQGYLSLPQEKQINSFLESLNNIYKKIETSERVKFHKDWAQMDIFTVDEIQKFIKAGFGFKSPVEFLDRNYYYDDFINLFSTLNISNQKAGDCIVFVFVFLRSIYGFFYRTELNNLNFDVDKMFDAAYILEYNDK